MHIVISANGSVYSTNGLRNEREKGKSLVSVLDDYISIDIETTGFDPLFDEIIEIGAVRYKGQIEVDFFQSLIKPQEKIPDFITIKTGITNDMVKDSPRIESVLPDFIDFIGGDVLLGHNVNFDINFLYDECLQHLGHKLQNNFVDTLRLSRRLFRDFENHRLDTLLNKFSLSARTLHRSLGDCRATADCYAYIKSYIIDNLIDISPLTSRNYSKNYLKAADIKAENDDFDEDHLLYGRVCVFTGALDKMVRKDAMQIVANLGGINGDGVTAKTNFLILGNNDYCSSIKDGKSSKQKKAEQLILKGQDLQIISENVFYDMVDL